MLLRFFFTGMLSFLLLSGCESDFGGPPPVEEETYVLLIAEFELLRHAAEIREQQGRRLTEGRVLPPDNLLAFAPEALKQDILSHYGVEEAELRTAHAYYSRDISEQKRRYREAIDRVNEAHSRLSEFQKEIDD